MNHEEAIAIINRYNRFTVLMQVVEETLEIKVKTYRDLLEGMKKMQKDNDEAVNLMRDTFRPVPTEQVTDPEGNEPDELKN